MSETTTETYRVTEEVLATVPDTPTAIVTLGPRFEDALAYAAHVHAGQLRKGTGVPYIAHLLAVASLVIEDGGSEDEAIAGLLHDAPEDQGGLARLADIRARFGEEAANIVEHCTDTFENPKPPWRPRKEKYLEELRSAPPPALRVSLADKLHNAKAMLRDYTACGEALWTRFSAGRADQLWYYRELANLFADCAPGRMADDLERVVRDLEAAVAGTGEQPETLAR